MGFFDWFLEDVETDDNDEEFEKIVEKGEINTIDFNYEYKKPKILEVIKGSYDEWWDDFCKEAKIVVITGARRTGKSLTAYALAENIAKTKDMPIYSLGTEEIDMPNFITNISDIGEMENDGILVVGEGGIESNSRKSMTKNNINLNQLLSIVSHKRIWLIFATQTSAKLDVGLLRECDAIILFKGSLLMKEMERPIIKKLYKKYEKYILTHIEKVKGKGVCVVYSDKMESVCRFKIPTFWSDELSVSYRNKEVMS